MTHSYYCPLLLFIILSAILSSSAKRVTRPAIGIRERCPKINDKLNNGYVRMKSRGLTAIFRCNRGYQLIGKTSAICVRSKWSNPLPICASNGCHQLQVPQNGVYRRLFNGALLKFDCNPGYTLRGSRILYCEGHNWNDSVPICEVATKNASLTCDFESRHLCGWINDPSSNLIWKITSVDLQGHNLANHHLYVHQLSADNHEQLARLFSPVYTAAVRDQYCFSFRFRTFGQSIGLFKLFVKRESRVFQGLKPLWERSALLADQWSQVNISIGTQFEPFQLVIEVVPKDAENVALDNFELIAHSNCTMNFNSNSNSNPNSSSFVDAFDIGCKDRCNNSSGNNNISKAVDDRSSNCSCLHSCNEFGVCCEDYAKYCLSNSSEVHSEYGNDVSVGNGVEMTSNQWMIGEQMTSIYNSDATTEAEYSEQTKASVDSLISTTNSIKSNKETSVQSIIASQPSNTSHNVTLDAVNTTQTIQIQQTIQTTISSLKAETSRITDNRIHLETSTAISTSNASITTSVTPLKSTQKASFSTEITKSSNVSTQLLTTKPISSTTETATTTTTTTSTTTIATTSPAAEATVTTASSILSTKIDSFSNSDASLQNVSKTEFRATTTSKEDENLIPTTTTAAAYNFQVSTASVTRTVTAAITASAATTRLVTEEAYGSESKDKMAIKNVSLSAANKANIKSSSEAKNTQLFDASKESNKAIDERKEAKTAAKITDIALNSSSTKMNWKVIAPVSLFTLFAVLLVAYFVRIRTRSSVNRSQDSEMSFLTHCEYS